MGMRRHRVALMVTLAAGTAVLGGAVAVARQPRPVDTPAASMPSAVQFAVIGDFGSNNSHEADVAALVAAATPDFVATVGDNAYGSLGQDTAVGQYYHEFIGAYTGAHGAGSTANRFFPALGNHDISDGPGLAGYLSFYTLPGAGITSLRPSGTERYYDVVQGPVHLFFLNSDPSEPNGRTASSNQARWLRNGLAASPSPWNVVVMHHAPFSSSSSHGSTAAMQWPFEDWGADLVLAGHDHTYERIARDDDGDTRPLTYVVDGLGGQAPYGFGMPVAGSQVRYNAGYGALFVDADASSLSAEFRAVSGSSDGTVIDSFVLTAPAPARITGTVTDGAGPVSGAMVHAVDYRADPAIILGDLTDAAGRYDIEVPAPDRYAIGVLDPSGARAFEYHEDDLAIDPANDAVVVPGATVTVDVQLAGSTLATGAITGRVTDGAAPIAGAWVTAVTASGVAHRAAVTDAAGAYTIEGLAAGSHKLIVVDPAGVWRWEWYADATSWGEATTILVAAGDTTDADVTLGPAP